MYHFIHMESASREGEEVCLFCLKGSSQQEHFINKKFDQTLTIKHNFQHAIFMTMPQN